MGSREDFAPNLLYTLNTMNIGLYSEEKPKTGVYENINNTYVVPMYVECYHSRSY